MKQERKLELLATFPPTPDRTLVHINSTGRKACNYAVFLAKNNVLYIRCYHHFSNGRTVEKQRYAFAEDGCVRYGVDDKGNWRVMTRFSEPHFFTGYYGYRDDTYSILGFDNIAKTCLRYSGLEHFKGSLAITYLKFYQKHKNVEYLVKQGYSHIVVSEMKYNSGHINWNSNNLLEMLGINRKQFKCLQGQEKEYLNLKFMNEVYPDLEPDEILELGKFFGYQAGSAERLTSLTGLHIRKLADYLRKNGVYFRDYSDYIYECRELDYDLTDKQINRPKNFRNAHERTSALVKYLHTQQQKESFLEYYEKRKSLEFTLSDYFIRQPESMEEIVMEGKELHHCVGGYAVRHAEGRLHIMFIRQRDRPDTPFFTVEVSTGGKIVQVKGLRNILPDDDLKPFVEEYTKFLNEHYVNFSESLNVSV